MLKDNKTLNVQDLGEEENLRKRALLLRPFTLSRIPEENLRYEAPDQIFLQPHRVKDRILVLGPPRMRISCKLPTA